MIGGDGGLGEQLRQVRMCNVIMEKVEIGEERRSEGNVDENEAVNG